MLSLEDVDYNEAKALGELLELHVTNSDMFSGELVHVRTTDNDYWFRDARVFQVENWAIIVTSKEEEYGPYVFDTEENTVERFQPKTIEYLDELPYTMKNEEEKNTESSDRLGQ